MDRTFWYPQQIVLDTLLLGMSKQGMIGLAELTRALLGSTTRVSGLVCAATAPASMSVTISGGSIYSLQNVDNTAFGSLPADTTHQVVKQGITLDPTTLTCAAPSIAGQSVYYLVQATLAEVDDNDVVEPFYNSAAPTVALSGPGGGGTASHTVRQSQCVVTAKAGIPAATGSQVVPAPDPGNVGLYAILIANGQTTITAANITNVGGTTFLSEKLTDKISQLTGDGRYLQLTGGTITGDLVGMPTTTGADITCRLLGNNNNLVTTSGLWADVQTRSRSNVGSIGTYNNTRLGLFTNNAERVSISPGGNMMVASTTDTGEQFQLNINGAAQTGLAVRDSASGTAAYGQITFYRGGTAVGAITTNTTTTNYGTTSDGRLKENVQPLTGCTAKLLALKPCSYQWSHIDGKPSGTGFIAQELFAVIPEAVIVGDDDASKQPGDKGFQQWGIDPAKTVPVLVGALQDALKRIAALEAKAGG